MWGIAELLWRARGLWALVAVSKEMPSVQALFRPDYTPPLLPISFPMSWLKNGLDLGLFRQEDLLDLSFERFFLCTKQSQICSLMFSCCSSVRYLSAAFRLAQIRLRMSEIWPREGMRMEPANGLIREKFWNWSEILGCTSELTGCYRPAYL